MTFVEKFMEKHRAKLKIAALAAMLGIPFFLYSAALHGSDFQVKLFLTLMAGNMFLVMKKG